MPLVVQGLVLLRHRCLPDPCDKASSPCRGEAGGVLGLFWKTSRGATSPGMPLVIISSEVNWLKIGDVVRGTKIDHQFFFRVDLVQIIQEVLNRLDSTRYKTLQF